MYTISVILNLIQDLVLLFVIPECLYRESSLYFYFHPIRDTNESCNI